jgi:hypothetical protein
VRKGILPSGRCHYFPILKVASVALLVRRASTGPARRDAASLGMCGLERTYDPESLQWNLSIQD